jgi:hypothetical protein
MNNPIKTIGLIIVLALSIQACDVNINTSDTSSVSAIALTITAQAAILQRANPQPANPSNVNPPAGNVNPPAPGDPNPPAAGQANPPAQGNANPSGSGAVNPPANGPATVTVSVETNCRKGPGLNYESVYSMSVSDVAEVIGKNTFTNYWIIKIPNHGGAICWLWGRYATVAGNTAVLVEYSTPTPQSTATATATKKPRPSSTVTNSPVPAAVPLADPSNVQATISCVDQGNGTTTYTGSMSWNDNSTGEYGFAVATMSSIGGTGPNVTSYNYSFNLPNAIYPPSTPLKFFVQALGAVNSAPAYITVSCP